MYGYGDDHVMLISITITVTMSAVRPGLMRAVRVAQFGGPEVLKVETNVPVPEPADDQVSVA